jgi:hypothetical protein
VHRVITHDVSAELLNGTASAAWRRYRDAQASILTAEQKARVASVVEHQAMIGGG